MSNYLCNSHRMPPFLLWYSDSNLILLALGGLWGILAQEELMITYDRMKAKVIPSQQCDLSPGQAASSMSPSSCSGAMLTISASIFSDGSGFVEKTSTS